MIPLLFLAGAATAQDLPAGEPVPEALDIQVSQAGLDALADVLPALLPADPLPVDDTSDSTGFGCLGYSYALENVWVVAQITSAAITAKNNEIELVADIDVQVNDAADPFDLTLDAICLIDDQCTGYVLPFPLTITAPIDFTIEGPEGSRVLAADIGAADIVSSLSSNELQTGCAIDDIESVLNIFGLSIFDLILFLFEDTLVEQIDAPLNDALVALSVDEQLEVGDAVVDLKLEPAGVSETTDGLEIVMSAIADAPVAHECVAAFDPGASVATGGPRPLPGDNPPGTHLAAHAAGDFINQALYAFWRGGLLCQEIGGPGSDLDLGGFPVDTSLLSLLAGDAFDELFPESSPLILTTVPKVPITSDPTGPNDLNVDLEDFELNFYGELDGRYARALGVDLDGQIGVDLQLDDTDGTLAVDLAVEEGDLTTSLAGDPMVPDAEVLAEDLSGSLVGLLDSVVGSLLGDSLAFPLPAFEGISLTELSTGASGPDGDWLGIYAQIGLVDWYDPYAYGAGCGCGSEGTSSDCSGGCDATRGSMAGWLLAAALVALRRRSR